MKIGNPETRVPPTVASPSRVQAGDSRTAEPSVVAVDASAKVKLSDAATELISTGKAAPEFDAEKVARIQKLIASGSFSVNAGAMADKMMNNARELLGKAAG